MTIIHFRFYHKDRHLSDSQVILRISLLVAWEVSDEALLGGCIPKELRISFFSLDQALKAIRHECSLRNLRKSHAE
jgi:hypothetical protein